MKQFMLAALVFVSLCFASCDKKNGFPNSAGGNLPSNYIFINSNEVTPSSLRIVRGGSITFVNNDDSLHSFNSYDTTFLKTGPIAPRSSFVFRKDTTGVFPYYCVQHPTVTGVIIIE